LINVFGLPTLVRNDRAGIWSLSLTKLNAQSTTEKRWSIAVGTEAAKAGVLLNARHA
jgi:hypothetical protein